MTDAVSVFHATIGTIGTVPIAVIGCSDILSQLPTKSSRNPRVNTTKLSDYGETLNDCDRELKCNGYCRRHSG